MVWEQNLNYVSRHITRTGVLLLSITSIYLTLLHQLFLGGIPWNYACFTMFGCAYGASLAPYLAKQLSDKMLKSAFALIAIVDGCLFLYQYAQKH